MEVKEMERERVLYTRTGCTQSTAGARIEGERGGERELEDRVELG